MKDGKYGVLVAHCVLYIILTLIAVILSAIIGGKCKAQTFTKDWTIDKPREALVVGFRKGDFLFELSFEYESGEEEKFAAPMAFSYLRDLKYGDVTLTFGAGVGFMLEVQWSGKDYDIFGNEITYPEIGTDTWFFCQTYVSINYDIFILTYHVKFSDDWIYPSFGGGFTW